MTPSQKTDLPAPLIDALYALKRHGHVSPEAATLLTDAGLAEPDPADVHTSLGTVFEFEFIRLTSRGTDHMEAVPYERTEAARPSQEHPRELADIVDQARADDQLIYARAVLETPAAANIERLYFRAVSGWFTGPNISKPDQIKLP